jgi:hypothetical protein
MDEKLKIKDSLVVDISLSTTNINSMDIIIIYYKQIHSS